MDRQTPKTILPQLRRGLSPHTLVFIPGLRAFRPCVRTSTNVESPRNPITSDAFVRSRRDRCVPRSTLTSLTNPPSSRCRCALSVCPSVPLLSVTRQQHGVLKSPKIGTQIAHETRQKAEGQRSKSQCHTVIREQNVPSNCRDGSIPCQPLRPLRRLVCKKIELGRWCFLYDEDCL